MYTAPTGGAFTDEQVATRATCKICLRPMPLRKDGAIHVHGPVGDRCPGSGIAQHPYACDTPPTEAFPQAGTQASTEDLSTLPFVRILKRLPRASCTSPISEEAVHHPGRSDSHQQFQQLDAPLEVSQTLSPCPY